MKRFVSAALLALAAVVFTSDNASAQQPYNNLGFFPYGFYQPYGARYGATLRTPPHFAVNPPVYYGARHARPYGVSPFASPPVVAPGADYRSRLRIQFEQPLVPTPGPAPRLYCNPCVSQADTEAVKPAMGQVRLNPFVESNEPEDHVAAIN